MNKRESIPLFERLIVESQSNCNRACWFCPRTYDRSGAYIDHNGSPVISEMPTEKILDLLDQAKAMGFSGHVGFHHYSEPLLDDRNIILAREARARGMQPYLHTNGDALKKNAELSREVAEIYSSIVVGIYDYSSGEELNAAKDFWAERLPGVELSFSAIAKEGASADSMAAPRTHVPSSKRMAVPGLTYRNGPCHRPRVRLIVRHDGEVCNCCEDTQAAFSLGNVYEQSLADIWRDSVHVQILADLATGKRERFPLCHACPMPPTGPPPPGVRIQLNPRPHSRSGS